MRKSELGTPTRSAPNIPAFNWNDLVYFLELSRQQSLVGAARQLKVDHTTVSRRVRELEDRLGVKLFNRGAEGYELTEAGRDLRHYAEAIEGHANSIAQGLSQIDAEAEGVVRVASMEAIGSFYFAPKFREFNERHPNISIELVTAAHWVSLSKREADILISFPPPQGRRLEVKKIGEFGLWLYASKDYLAAHGAPQTRAELDDHPLVGYIEDQVQIDTVRWLGDSIGPHDTRFRSTSLVAQWTATAAGAGVAMLPTFLAENDPRLARVLEAEVHTTRDIWLSTHSDLLHLPRIKAAYRFIKEVIAEDEDFLLGRS